MNIEYVTTNLTGMVRNETMEGRNYLVVPMIMMVEGVLNGSNGPLYYPAEELAKVPVVWNHKPVVVYHPSMNGKSLSACDPDIINTHKIGIIMNTTFDGKRLKAEAWLEESRIQEIDARVMEAISTNKMMEVSTGVFTENEDTSGEFNGRKYDAIARNYRPDHLAILPDQIGACSIADGAGLLRTNSANNSDIKRALEYLGVVDNEMSHGEIHHQLRAALDPTLDKPIWIEDTFDDWFVFEKEGKLYKQGYSIKNEDVQLDGIPVQVEKKIVYEDMNGKIVSNEKKENAMDKEKFVSELIDNSAWTEEDRKFLMSLNEGQLKKLVPVENEGEPEKPEQLEVPEAVKTEAVPANNQIKEITAEEFLSKAPAGIREVLNDAMSNLAGKRTELISKITANKRNTFTKDQLAGLHVNELAAIAALAVNETEQPKPNVHQNYFGGMAPVFEGNTAAGSAVEDEPLEAPVMNFSKES